MHQKTPILFIAYTRTKYLKKSITNIMNEKDRLIYVSIDKVEHQQKKKFEENSKLISDIKKLSNYKIIIHINDEHLGLRKNVKESVSRVLEKHSKIIVCEDDVVVDINGLRIFDYLLDRYENEPRVAHVSIYNRVPIDQVSNSNDDVRFSNIPETYIWGTWKNKWTYYDDNLSKNLKILKLKNIKQKVGTWIGAITWKLHIWEAKVGIVDSWAYRWLAALWLNNLICITTNKNYVKYYGHEKGTHTNSIIRKKQLEKSFSFQRRLPNSLHIDMQADSWTLKHDANGTILRFPIKIVQTLGSISVKAISRFKS
jgi:hypothetical protein